jgi:plasmid segregation protein ParM
MNLGANHNPFRFLNYRFRRTAMSKRKTAEPSLPGSIITVGLDIGYGVVKAVTDSQEVVFPSVMGHAREIKFQKQELAERHPGDQLTDEDGSSWFIGELALAQLPPGELLRLRGRTANEKTMGNAFRLRLAKAAIGKLAQGVYGRDVIHLRICSGLPVDHMRDAGELKQALLGQHLICTDAAEVIANVTDVMVMPQPYGSAYAMMITATGEINVHHTYMRTGVVDVGTYTVDIILDDDGDYIDAESGSIESGVYTAQERIAEMLERDYREKMPQKIVEQVLRTGVFTASGKPVDYRQEVEDALAPLRSATLNLLSEKWQRGTTVDVIYLSGGGAELVYEQVADAYPQTKLVPEAQLANARGYLHYAHFVGRSAH